ncbi:Flp pilus assembly protein [Vibrio variabilis]|uniref:Flp pilus assembly protein n=1 Tax=Vibrio variabilis TaxID=990271 RepID=A0ABQ0JJ86_9VIBR|nr:Flp pilus assembly protein [Vibrio variabilis]
MITKLYIKTVTYLRQFKDDEKGVTAIEYGLIAVAMAVLLAAALGADGFIGNLETAFTNVSNTVSSLNSGAGS